jgi:1-acyl-sn-glycerol-3-phosphate acyltransferase
MAKEFKKLDMHQPPIKTRWYILPILWFLVDCALIGVKHKIIKENFKKIKGGCLIVSNHMCFEDMKLLQKLLFPRRSFYISSIDEFVDKEWIMRRLGCLPKKVHYRDMALVRTMVRLLKKGNIVS